jgi:hypothetical protein
MTKEEIAEQIESELAMALMLPALRVLCIQRVTILWELYRMAEAKPGILILPARGGQFAD